MYAEGDKLCIGSPSRQGFTLDVPNLNLELRRLAQARCGLNALRTYWYDGTHDGIRTAIHQEIAALPNVKLRLGGINLQGQQKGVDALVYRELMMLSRERAISDAFLLSGDEDLCEGVRTAQDQGARVTVIGIATRGGARNQSRELMFGADEVMSLTRKDISRFFTVAAPPAPAGVPAATESGISETGADFATRWRSRASEEEIRDLSAQYPRIPSPLDIELLRHAESALGSSLRDDDEARRRLRRAFWDVIKGGGHG